MVRVLEFDDFTEFKRRWNQTLTYYPDVARAGNLAVAITRALAQTGSSLRAYCPYPPDRPVWSAHTDHEEAPGQTVPQFARVRLGHRHCEVRIASPRHPLGSYGLSFYKHDIDTYLPRPYEGSHTFVVGGVVATGVGSAVSIIRRALEDGARIHELALEFDLPYEPPPSPTKVESYRRFFERMMPELDETERDELAEEAARRGREAMKRENADE